MPKVIFYFGGDLGSSIDKEGKIEELLASMRTIYPQYDPVVLREEKTKDSFQRWLLDNEFQPGDALIYAIPGDLTECAKFQDYSVNAATAIEPESRERFAKIVKDIWSFLLASGGWGEDQKIFVIFVARPSYNVCVTIYSIQSRDSGLRKSGFDKKA